MNFIFILLFSFQYSQNIPTDGSKNPAVVTLTGNAQIFSTDDSFNRQLSSQKIILENAVTEKKAGKNSSSATIIKTPKKSAGAGPLKKELLKTAARKKREVQNRIKIARQVATKKDVNLAYKLTVKDSAAWSALYAFKKLNCVSHDNSSYASFEIRRNFYDPIVFAIHKEKAFPDFSQFFHNYLLTSGFSVRPPPAFIS
ncbi:hypothetical protein ASG01_14400 [Chryseobacterium sp. Leaf180]|uniref:hypothetical protein n=1 Tax=Chryseobacterium sp. Leaf180 TaxID=1736289 RepID=UPI0006F3E09F|nr:hypothetical protein [Chryseobacterium sp. Leaf180]KQR91076.1 hypothetical protein ASG01_14400 [Chryseobacterium sp. Leaf180]